MDNRTFTDLIKEQFFLYDVAGDGNCYYSSIALHYARRNDSTRDTQRQVRMDIYNYVKGHLDEFAGFYESLEEYNVDVTKIRNDREFCPNFAPLATARCYGVNVVVIRPGEGDLDWLVLPAAERFEDTIFVSYHNEDHYNYLVPLMPASARHTVEEKISKNINDEGNSNLRQQQQAAKDGAGTRKDRKRSNDGIGTDDHNKLSKPTVVPNQVFKCPSCIKTFKYEWVRDEHAKSMHGHHRPFSCEQCGASFATQQSLRSHRSTVHKPRNLTCDYDGCNRVFSSAGTLFEHRKTHETEHECVTCEQVFDTYSKLKRHRKTHKEANPPLRCEDCPTKTFSSKQQLANHKRRVHEAQLHQCTLCPSIIKGDDNYKKHLRNVHPSIPNQFQCRHCEKLFHAKVYLDEHILKVHVNGEYLCPECNKIYKSAASLRHHIARVHADGHHECDEENCNAVFKCAARLHTHKVSVHVEHLHVCTYCESCFKTKNNLTTHLHTVHSMARDYTCELADCGKSFKQYTALLKHQRSVHEKERQHVCDVCSIAFWSNSHLCRHKKSLHGTEADTETRRRFECKLCTPPLNLSNNATWVFHRLIYHSDQLAPGDPKMFRNIYTSSLNRIFVAGNKEMEHYMQNCDRKCTACNIQFYSEESQRNHIQIHHVQLNVKYRDFEEAFFECRHSQLLKGSREAFNKIYHLSHEIFSTVDAQRKVYDILLLPAAVEEDQIQPFVSTKGNQFYVYSGSRATLLQRHRSTLVSPHHTSNHGKVVCTNVFMKIAESGPVKYNAFLINEKYLTTSDQSISCRQLIRKQEAMDIFTLFYFAKRFDRSDVFFQTLEYEEMKQFTLEEIRTVIEEVDNSQGILTNLRRFGINMVKPIKISTDHVHQNDYAFSRCVPCQKRRIPLLVSRFHVTKHEMITHRKRPETLTEQLLMMPASLDPNDVYDLLQDCNDDKEFWVYFAVGSNKPIKSLHEALNLNTEGYVGQATGNPVSPYHFAQNRQCSALKKLRARYNYVYLVANWRFETAQEMQRAEISLIVLGSGLIRESSAGRPGVVLINKHIEMYAISNIFEKSEWNLLYDQCTAGRSQGFQAALPRFIRSNPRIEEIVDITARIPLVSDNHSSDNETEENDD